MTGGAEWQRLSMESSTRPDVGAIVTDLATAVGYVLPTEPTDVDRWQVYLRAMTEPDLHDQLRVAVRAEGTDEIALATVYLILEQVPYEQAPNWIDALTSPVHRGQAIRRLAELQLLHALSDDVPVDCAPWSDWLQRRLAEPSASRPALIELAEHGRTRRVRAAAAQALRRSSADSRVGGVV